MLLSRRSKTTLNRRINGGKSKKEACEYQQLWTRQEEKALAEWISYAVGAGSPVGHDYIHEMAHEIQVSRVGTEGTFIRPTGEGVDTRVFSTLLLGSIAVCKDSRMRDLFSCCFNEENYML
jgi:hypothetical protein